MARTTRRQHLAQLSAGAFGLAFPGCASLFQRDKKPKSIAAVATVWYKLSHTDVILEKILNGWAHDGGPGPNLTLTSLYIDQFPPGPAAGDIGRQTAAAHGVPIFDTIEGAVTAGTNGIPVDGVLLIGEHGSYPQNEKGQDLYPRRRFLTEITATFEKYDRVVPVFNDKHLGPVWEDALWMYERARELKVPFMAGSSMPVMFREPDVSLPMGCEIESAVAFSYAALDRYCFHALEFLQTFVERRRGAETGVKSVQWFGADEMWRVVDAGVVRRDLVDAALAALPRGLGARNKGLLETKGPRVGMFLFEYYDGLTAAVFNLPGFLGAVGVALELKGRSEPIVVRANEQAQPAHPHFAYLLKANERMFHTGVPSYPVERTLLTTGILDRALTSRFEGGKKLETPELAIRYTPVDYPHAPLPPLN